MQLRCCNILNASASLQASSSEGTEGEGGAQKSQLRV